MLSRYCEKIQPEVLDTRSKLSVYNKYVDEALFPELRGAQEFVDLVERLNEKLGLDIDGSALNQSPMKWTSLNSALSSAARAK